MELWISSPTTPLVILSSSTDDLHLQVTTMYPKIKTTVMKADKQESNLMKNLSSRMA